jgi:hypothetical protein
MKHKLASIAVGFITVAVGLAARQADDRKLLGDPDLQVRLKAALPVARQYDEQGIGVLIDLLAELRPANRRLAKCVLQDLAEEWAPNPGLTGDDEVSRRISWPGNGKRAIRCLGAVPPWFNAAQLTVPAIGCTVPEKGTP